MKKRNVHDLREFSTDTGQNKILKRKDITVHFFQITVTCPVAQNVTMFVSKINLNVFHDLFSVIANLIRHPVLEELS